MDKHLEKEREEEDEQERVDTALARYVCCQFCGTVIITVHTGAV